jgi:hypothetical protein
VPVAPGQKLATVRRNRKKDAVILRERVLPGMLNALHFLSGLDVPHVNGAFLQAFDNESIPIGRKPRTARIVFRPVQRWRRIHVETSDLRAGQGIMNHGQTRPIGHHSSSVGRKHGKVDAVHLFKLNQRLTCCRVPQLHGTLPPPGQYASVVRRKGH